MIFQPCTCEIYNDMFFQKSSLRGWDVCEQPHEDEMEFVCDSIKPNRYVHLKSNDFQKYCENVSKQFYQCSVAPDGNCEIIAGKPRVDV